MSRRQLKPERWRELVGRQRTSGLTVEAYCRRQRLATSTFYAWRHKLAAVEAPAFVELMPKADVLPPRPGVGAAVIEVSVRGGVTVRVGEGFDAGLLRQIIEALS